MATDWQNDLARLDHEWELEREQYLRTTRSGHRYVPTVDRSIYTGLVAVVCGIVWITFTSNIFPNTEGYGLFFPLFGLAFIGVGLWLSVANYNLAQHHEQAHAAYLERRQRLLNAGPPTAATPFEHGHEV
jgi:hypothetical protein